MDDRTLADLLQPINGSCEQLLPLLYGLEANNYSAKKGADFGNVNLKLKEELYLLYSSLGYDQGKKEKEAGFINGIPKIKEIPISIKDKIESNFNLGKICDISFSHHTNLSNVEVHELDVYFGQKKKNSFYINSESETSGFEKYWFEKKFVLDSQPVFQKTIIDMTPTGITLCAFSPEIRTVDGRAVDPDIYDINPDGSVITKRGDKIKFEGSIGPFLRKKIKPSFFNKLNGFDKPLKVFIHHADEIYGHITASGKVKSDNKTNLSALLKRLDELEVEIRKIYADPDLYSSAFALEIET